MSHTDKEEAEVGKLTAIFWAEFVTYATLPVHYDCIDEAIKRSGLANLYNNNSKLKPPKKKPDIVVMPDDFDKALQCAAAAGREAKKIAESSKPPKTEIDVDVFKKAWDCVEKGCTYLMERENRKEDVVKIEALIC